MKDLLLLSPKDILKIYEAGIERGSDETTAFDWGTTPSEHRLSKLEEAFLWTGEYSIISSEQMDYDEKVKWWKEYKKLLEAN